MELSFDLMYQACLEKDKTFEGLFITAVKTTGIFCRPSCTARKPKKENVEFFKTTKEALLHGYRPCKVCRPLQKQGETPDSIKSVMNELMANPSLRLKDGDLRQRGIEPSHIRRWFIKNHGITFHAYQRLCRINTAFKKIQQGESVTNTAFESGFDSLSGFGDSFKSVFGVAPSDSKSKRVIDLKRLETPLGTMIACAVEEGLCLLEFSDRKMLEREFKDLAKALNATIVQGENAHFNLVEEQLAEYFDGKRKEFSVPLFTPGSHFQQQVWQALQRIPYGSTASYKQQAINIGKPDAVRAVANANGMNRVAILVPCHRVIGSDGSLTGYAGGIRRKQWLLSFEQRNSFQQQTLIFEDLAYKL